MIPVGGVRGAAGSQIFGGPQLDVEQKNEPQDDEGNIRENCKTATESLVVSPAVGVFKGFPCRHHLVVFQRHTVAVTDTGPGPRMLQCQDAGSKGQDVWMFIQDRINRPILI